jgi:pimeloyl-ACP methyl ester carboxylesterase
MRAKTLAVSLVFLFLYQSVIAQPSIVGHWEGSIKIQGQELMIKVDFRTADAGLEATIDIPQQNAKSLALKNVRYEHPKAHFELPAGPGLAVFEGERNGSLITGKFTQAGMEGSFSLELTNPNKLEVVEEAPPKYKPVVGVWDGAIEIIGKTLGISITFKTKGGELKATIDIPEQSAFALPLTNVRFDSSKVHCDLPAGPGLAVFDGALKGDSVSGVFKQAGMTGTFHLVRGIAKEGVEQPVEIVPYKKEEVVFHSDTVKLAGTLTIPSTPGPHPAVVMITGSGPQNRDEELFGFKPFKLIADHFTRNGIAVLRYDDRGVGGSSGSTSQSTTADFAKDVLAAIHFLQSRNDINPKQIGLCGHSEGGIVAPLAASESRDVAFVICIAGTGVDGRKTILAQQEAIMRADTATEDAIRKALNVSQLAFDLALSQKDSVEVRKALRASVVDEMNAMTNDQRKAITNEEEFIRIRVEAQITSFQSPWFKFFLTYDPSPALEKVKCPVLALFGGLDLQVLAELNKNAMESALKMGGNKDYTFQVFPKADHLFLTAATGSPSEYSKLKKEFVPGFLETMTKWILKRTTIPK